MRAAALALLCLCTAVRAALCDELILPNTPIERGRPLEAIYRLHDPISGTGTLRLEWTDALHRVVERRIVRFDLHGSTDIPLRIDTARAIALWNRLSVRIGDRRTVAASFIVSPPEDAWRDYRVIMWQAQTPAAYATLRRVGVDGGMLIANRASPYVPPPAEFDRLVQSDLRYYVENIATDFYSAYHRWTPDHPVNWRFVEAQKRYLQDHDERAFIREPSLSDPEWLAQIRRRLAATVAVHRAYRPLFYNLADETGIADLAAFWDFDLSAPSLAAMRDWLKTQYADLAALNAEWGSDFARWDDVVPMTTAAAMRRADQNFAAWADFKAWMDVAFARALAAGRDAVHAADPSAIAAIEGAQVPGWGGYDYSLLAPSVDAMEMVDESVDLARAFNPELKILTTSFGSGKAEAARIWRLWLKGSRGAILWDDQQNFVDAGGRLGVRGRDAMRYFGALRNGLGATVINSERQYDPVAILYSPASMRTQWMLDWKDKGDAWAHRDSEVEGGGDNTVRSAMDAYKRAIQQLGIEPRFIAPASLGSGTLLEGNCRILIMPHVVSLSAVQAEAIRRFVEAGGTIVADSEPGLFDEHSRKLATPLLQDLFAAGAIEPGKGSAVYLPPVGMRLKALFAAQGVAPAVEIKTASGAPATDVEMHRFKNGDLTIIGLQRWPDRTPATASSQPISVDLARDVQVYDLRARKSLGRRRHLRLALDPFEPTLLMLSDRILPRPTLKVPAHASRGATAMLRISVAGPSGAAFRPLHVDVHDPSGKTIPWYSGNLDIAGGTASYQLPLALNDPAGTWHIRVTDVLSGYDATASMQVMPR